MSESIINMAEERTLPHKIRKQKLETIFSQKKVCLKSPFSSQLGLSN
ncbi:hypothetical protein pb186bvf_019085 [Paramecium bursaria]